MEKKQARQDDPPYDIHVHSVRKRSVDTDGICAKYAIDGLVHAGILEDDSSKFVRKVSYSQEVASQEKTIITIKKAE